MNEAPEILRNDQESALLAFWRRRMLPWGVACMLILFHTGMNLWWLHADNHTIRTDEETHMAAARAHYEALFTGDASPGMRLWNAFRIPPGNPAHPPLLAVLGACMIAVFGYSVDVLAATNTVLFAWVLLGILLIARRLFPPWPACFALFVAGFSPIVFVSSRYFMTDYPSLALTVWAMYALMRCDRFRNRRWAVLFGLFNGLGILARSVTFIYYLAPCLLAVAGGCGGVWNRDERSFPFRPVLRVALNAALSLVVTLLIAGPWHAYHFMQMREYWLHQRAAAHAPAPVVTVPPAPTLSPISSSTVAAAQSGNVIVARRYLVFAVNNGVFLGLLLAGAIGFFAWPFLKRFRHWDTLLLAAWLLGSYAILTFLLRYKLNTARYTLQAIPALALFAVYAVMLPKGRWARVACGAALAGVLIFQYLNLTVGSFGAWGTAYLPARVDPGAQKFYGDPGIALWKDTLTLGFSYSCLGAPTLENYKDPLFEAMIASERSRFADKTGDACYLRLNMRGMEFDEQHYWPGGPYQRHDMTLADLPKRRLRSIDMDSRPEPLLRNLPNADYIVYSLEADNAGVEAHWQIFLDTHGFVRLDRFVFPGCGSVPDCIYAVYVKNTSEDALEPVREEMIAESRAAKNDVPLNDAVSFAGIRCRPVEGDWQEITLLFKTAKPLQHDWRVYMHVVACDKADGLTPFHNAGSAVQRWNFDPVPPTSHWPSDGYVVIRRCVEAPPGCYWLRIGLFDRNDGYYGVPVFPRVEMGSE